MIMRLFFNIKRHLDNILNGILPILWIYIHTKDL